MFTFIRTINVARITAIASVLAGSLALSPVAQAEILSKDLESRLVKVCEAIQGDSRLALKRAIKNSGVRYSALAEGLVCDGQDVYTFALSQKADNVLAMLNRNGHFDHRELTAQR